MKQLWTSVAVAALLALPAPTLLAQSDDGAAAETAAVDGLMTSEELQDLVGPIALYPDTLLIQILVAATFPLDVIKADRLVQDNEGKSADELQALIEAEGWDESVNVLAEAFPDVLADMAVHVEWTQTLGEAMLAQSEDVMNAVQDMRQIANDNGALQSGEEQTVEVTQDAGDETIIIQPADPQTVYVPQYDPEVVYVDSDSGTDTGDLVAAGLITFGTVALINEIFDDDDYWGGYWGCRNCGGWGGGPIIRNPNVDIDVDGNVNIGNNIGNDIGWKPDDDRRDKARDDIRKKRDPENGRGPITTKKPDRGDEMRARLSKETGAADISRPGADRSQVKRPEAGNLANHKPAIDRTKAPSRPQAAAPKAKPKVNRPAQAKPAARKPSHAGGGHAIQKRAPAQRAHAGGNRGRAAAGGGRGGGRRR
ncbi:MAG: DUF3300 domain-containing protein [Paracoccaceae bacterium]